MTLITEALLWVPSAGFAAAGAAAWRYRSKYLAADARTEERLAIRDKEARQLAESRLPDLVYALQNGIPPQPPPLRYPGLANTPTDVAYQSVLDQVRDLIEESVRRAEASSRAAVQSSVRSVQALLYEQQGAITRLLEAAHDEKTLALVQPIDHTGSQLARRLQILGVLTGMWPGRQRQDVPLLDAVRGGMSRIRDYSRVRPPQPSRYHVSSRYVEPVVLALAELLDNAARHSPPHTPVEVHFVEGQQGVSIEIHDAGSGMPAEVRQEAMRRLSGQVPVRLTELRNPPSFGHLGVGALASKYGFRVQIDEEHSRHGGVRAVVYLPYALLTTPPAHSEQSPTSARQAAHTAPARPLDPSVIAAAGKYQIADDGLAERGQRRSGGRTVRTPAPRQLAAPESPPPGSGRNLAAFVQARRAAQTDPQISPYPASEDSPR